MRQRRLCVIEQKTKRFAFVVASSTRKSPRRRQLLLKINDWWVRADKAGLCKWDDRRVNKLYAIGQRTISEMIGREGVGTDRRIEDPPRPADKKIIYINVVDDLLRTHGRTDQTELRCALLCTWLHYVNQWRPVKQTYTSMDAGYDRAVQRYGIIFYCHHQHQ